MNQAQEKFFEESKNLTEEITIVLRKHECPALADKLLIMMGKLEGVIKYHSMQPPVYISGEEL